MFCICFSLGAYINGWKRCFILDWMLIFVGTCVLSFICMIVCKFWVSASSLSKIYSRV